MRKLIVSVVSLLSMLGCEGSSATVGAGELSNRGSPTPSNSAPHASRALALANQVSCTTPAPRAFAGALCVCEDLSLAGSGLTTASAMGANAAVGVNGTYRVAGHHKLGGTLAVGGDVSAAGTLEVSEDAIAQQMLSGAGHVKIAKDLSVGGDLWFGGDLQVGGTLRVRGTEQILGSAVTRRGPYQAPAGLPCGCNPASLIDVAAEVAAAASRNDNASIGLNGVMSAGVLKLELPGGRYYVANASQAGVFELHVTQPSALYVQGALRSAGAMKVNLEPGATLDVYVAGTFAQAGWTITSGDPGSVRFYVGGRDSMILGAGHQVFVGSIYAPEAEVSIAGDTQVHGSLFAKKLSGAGVLNIDFAEPSVPTNCTDGGVTPEPLDAGGEPIDAGVVEPADAGVSFPDDGGIT